jgi:hypothetical protein
VSQSSVIAFFLLGGFIVYITIKGELPKYAATVGIGAASSGSSTLSAASTVSAASTATSGTASQFGIDTVLSGLTSMIP